MEIYVKISYISIFSLFLCFSDMILSDALISTVSELQTQLVMTSQIRSHIEYIIQTFNIILIILQSKLLFRHFNLTKNIIYCADFITI